ncbi:AAA family ATPase [Mycolicibacterium crocinum]|uniref:AAA family ATPase n=2 Tax=Mycolicibacterium crocinum TaxID=388459 RepID=A0ABY3TLY0_9MYCO|nr:AAA family ATPase [Mycolicibacterium crocinum]ULN42476.2 AAA family ATPase [Mycolicibacterium crocinum]
MRAEPLLRSRLKAPRKERLSQVLATLQPEQYRLITAPASDSIIIEGGPGTGKTIIASHRAAYFIHDDPNTPTTCDGDIILIGPTPEYCKHVSEVIHELTGDSPRVKVVALTDLNDLPLQRRNKVPSELNHVSAGDKNMSSRLPKSLRGTKTSIPALVHAARVQLTAGRDMRLTVAKVYEFVRGNGSAGRPLTQEFAWRNYLRTLPSYTQAQSNRSLSWLLESIEHSLGPFAAPNAAVHPVAEEPRNLASPIRHVIVDEAQDLTASDWLSLRAIGHEGGWTIIGDLDQRRADNTFRHWTSVLKAVGLPGTTPCSTLQRGYRSTIPILEFAHRLLPRDTYRPIALQTDGPAPRIVETIREHVAGTVIQQIDRLVSQYPAGTIAVITTTPGLINTRLKRDPQRPNVKVLGVNQARGLEFDGVIVVEPADFPHNDRRQGPLYTALTRPNRELVVVHTKVLPLELQSGPRAAVRPTATNKPTRAATPRRRAKATKPKLRRLPKPGKSVRGQPGAPDQTP